MLGRVSDWPGVTGLPRSRLLRSHLLESDKPEAVAQVVQPGDGVG